MAIDAKKLAGYAERAGASKGKPKRFGGGHAPPETDGPAGNPGPDEETAEGEPHDDEADRLLAAEVGDEVEDGQVDEEVARRVEGYDPEVDGNPPAWVADEATWERAKKAVDPEGEGAHYAQPWAVVATVYQRMGGELK